MFDIVSIKIHDASATTFENIERFFSKNVFINMKSYIYIRKECVALLLLRLNNQFQQMKSQTEYMR